MLSEETTNTVFEFIRSCRREFRYCIELGNGGSDFETTLLDAFPALKLDSYNLSNKDKLIVESKLTFYQGRFRFIVSDYRKENIGHGHDLVVSLCDFITLSKEEKQRLFIKVQHALSENGLFIYGDRVKAPSEKMRTIYVRSETSRYLQQPSENMMQHELAEKSPGDRNHLTIDDQTYWMRKAAFKDVDCVWKRCNTAVFAGFK